MHRSFIALLTVFVPTLALAATFNCQGGDVACLIAALTEANANGKPNQITVDAGIYTLTAIDNHTDGSNGLPSITSPLTLQGAGAEVSILERNDTAPFFRLVHVAATGKLSLKGL